MHPCVLALLDQSTEAHPRNHLLRHYLQLIKLVFSVMASTVFTNAVITERPVTRERDNPHLSSRSPSLLVLPHFVAKIVGTYRLDLRPSTNQPHPSLEDSALSFIHASVPFPRDTTSEH